MSEQAGFKITGTKLECYTGPNVEVLEIPEGVTEIVEFGLRRSNLNGCRKIIFPTTLRVVGRCALNFGGDDVQELEFLGDVKTIGDNAFDSVGQYSKKGIRKITFHGSVGDIEGSAFGRAAITELVFPKGVNSIGRDAFYGCKKLKRLYAPTVKKIGTDAFAECVQLQELEISPKTTLGERAFNNCKKLGEDGIVVVNGVLVYLESGKKCPPGVHTIDQGALNGKVEVPASVRTIHDQGYSTQLVFPEGFFLTDEKLGGAKIISTLRYQSRLTRSEIAALYLFQSGKQIEGIVAPYLKKDFEALAVEMVSLLLAKGKAKHYLKAVEFVMEHAGEISGETIRALYDVGVSKKYKKEAPLLERYMTSEAEQTAEEAPEEDICAPFREAFDPYLQEKYFKKNKGKEALLQKVHLKTGAEAPVFLTKCAIVPYLEQYTERPKHIGGYKTDSIPVKLVELADQAAQLLNLDQLRTALDALYLGGGSGWLLPLCRYGSREQVSNLISNMRKWEDWYTYGSTGRSDIITARGALMLSDIREAMMYLDKCGQLNRYASLRHMDEDSLRDTVLADFGLDAQGKMVYHLGGRTVEVSLAPNLSLKLWDVEAGKEVKSLPKKGSDPELLAAASASLSDMKKNLKKVVKGRNDILFTQFLTGGTRSAKSWKSSYLGNPVLNMVGRLLVWNQGENTFILSESGPVDCWGNPCTIRDTGSIGVAHPMEMTGETVQQWRQYLCSKGIVQPFEQMWEPAHSAKTVAADRYAGAKVSVFRFMNNGKHGISFYDEDFHNDIGFWLSDCDLEYERTQWHRHEIGKDETFTLGAFSFRKYTRRVNHLVYLLDKWTVLDRIARDDTSVESILPSFTLAQITEFIRVATESGSTNVTALLLNYKNQNFADYDPMEAFSLDL